MNLIVFGSNNRCRSKTSGWHPKYLLKLPSRLGWLENHMPADGQVGPVKKSDTQFGGVSLVKVATRIHRVGRFYCFGNFRMMVTFSLGSEMGDLPWPSPVPCHPSVSTKLNHQSRSSLKISFRPQPVRKCLRQTWFPKPNLCHACGSTWRHTTLGFQQQYRFLLAELRHVPGFPGP